MGVASRPGNLEDGPMTDPTLQNVFDDIRRNLEAVHDPSADRNWSNDLARDFEGYPIVDRTDFDLDRSNLFLIVIAKGSSEKFIGTISEEIALLHRLEGNEYYILGLRLSVVAPYYLVRLMRRTLGDYERPGDNERLVDTDVLPQTDEQAELLRRAHAFARGRGFTSIPREYLEHLVPGVESERAGPGKTTVFYCLFADEEYLPD